MGEIYENKIGAFGSHLTGNIYKAVSEEISKEKHHLTYNFFSETGN